MDVSPQFAIGETDVSIRVASSASDLSEAGPTRIYLFVDSQQTPTLIGQSGGAGGLGASAEDTVHLTAGTHRITVACQSASGANTYASADVNVVGANTLMVIGIIGVGLIAVLAIAASSGSSAAKTAVQPNLTAPPPPMPSIPANDTAPVLASSTPQLLRDPGSQSQSNPHRCADAVTDRDALIDLLQQKQALQSEITSEWNQHANTSKALLDVYRSLCDERRNLWIATSLNSLEGWAAWTYRGASFAHNVSDDVGKALDLKIPSLDKGLKIVATRRGEALLREALAKETGRAVVHGMADAFGQPGAGFALSLEKFPEKKEGMVDEVVQHVLDENAKVHGELVDKLTDAFAADVAEYQSNAQVYNASVLRWNAEKQAAMDTLARSIDAAHRALASSFLDCHGRVFDDSALQSGNVDLGGAGLRLAVGDPSDLEVPVDVAFPSLR